MEARDFASKSHSLRHRCRQLLGNFFRALQNEDPWWVSLHEPVNGEMQTCITHFLGFEHAVGVEFLCTTGLLKVGNSRNPHITVVVQSEWEKFVLLIGYSYGSLITSSASASIPQCIGCVLISPSFSVMDWLLMFNSSHHMAQAKIRSDIPRLFVIGDRDNFTSLKVFFDYVVTFPNHSTTTATSYVVIPKADHFFVGSEHTIATIVGQWWEKQQQQQQQQQLASTNSGKGVTIDALSSNIMTSDGSIFAYCNNHNIRLLEQISPLAGTPSLEIIDPNIHHH